MNACDRRLRASLALLLAALLAGCFGRQQTVQAVTQLGTTSERANAVAVQLKASDAAKTETLGKLYDSLLDTLKTDAEHEVDAHIAAFMRDVNAGETNALRDMLTHRADFLRNFAASVDEMKKPLVQANAAAAREVEAARSESLLHPNDQDLQQKLNAATRRYFAIYSVLARLESESALQAYDAIDTAVATFAADIHAAADKARATASEAATRTKAAFATKRAAAAKPGIPADTEAYDALIAYTAAVRQSADSFKNYLAANSLGRNSFVGELGRSVVDNLVPSTLRVLQGDRVKPADLLSSARTVGTEVFGELKSNVQSDTTSLLDSFKGSLVQAGQNANSAIAGAANAFLTKFLPQVTSLKPDAASDPSMPKENPQ